ncbi:phosphotransferase system, lactose/cellobiose-specific IIB subunit [Clostridium sartagoforme AAU1]|uniref:Phosphotransferase system, lactose/cellobiose-specific IIB subunit n=1 Tax=Clostridium sartagoforme AAU1 TaxID=1202534 RepID=R9BTX7_9CLOT|nr:phosphotransferase system, lactose/cellobiose-specific IIB subunit [Clostridium sartagoforme AAU1]
MLRRWFFNYNVNGQYEKTVRASKKLNEEDFEFVAIPVDLLEHEADNCDVVVVGPQIAHKLDYIKKIIDPKKFRTQS